MFAALLREAIGSMYPPFKFPYNGIWNFQTQHGKLIRMQCNLLKLVLRNGRLTCHSTGHNDNAPELQYRASESKFWDLQQIQL